MGSHENIQGDASAKFTEVSFDFSPVYMTGSGAKRETPCK